MYVVLGVIFLLFTGAFALAIYQVRTLVAAESRPVPNGLDLREELHRRMLDKVLRGIGPDDDMLFKDLDRMFEESMTKSFSGFGASSEDVFKTAWSESGSGRRLTVTPKDKKQQLDINIENEMVSIKGIQETQSPQGSSRSQFSYAFSIPGDCDSSKVKMGQNGDDIVIDFPYKDLKKVQTPKLPDNRKPLPKQGNEVEI